MNGLIMAILAATTIPGHMHVASSPPAPLAFASSNDQTMTKPARANDLSTELPLGTDNLCRLTPKGEAALAPLMVYDKTSERFRARGSLRLPDGRTVEPVVFRERTHEGNVMTQTTANLRMPENVTWYGLPIAEIDIVNISVEESDSADWREFTFNVPAKALQARLATMGQKVPMKPKYLDVNISGRADGAAFITTDGKRSKLRCVWGY